VVEILPAYTPIRSVFNEKVRSIASASR
jgi:hypothetical protein